MSDAEKVVEVDGALASEPEAQPSVASSSSSAPVVEALPQREQGRSRRKRGRSVEASEKKAVDEHLQALQSEAVERLKQFEYLDHTADVQIHSWGNSLATAFENAGIAMFNYMTELNCVDIDLSLTREIEAEGHDLDTLLFSFLQEALYMFSTEYLVCKIIKIESFDRENFNIKAKCYGDTFDMKKHEQGTEVKAITYSNMQIWEKPDSEKSEIFVIVDI